MLSRSEGSSHQHRAADPAQHRPHPRSCPHCPGPLAGLFPRPLPRAAAHRVGQGRSRRSRAAARWRGGPLRRPGRQRHRSCSQRRVRSSPLLSPPFEVPPGGCASSLVVRTGAAAPWPPPRPTLAWTGVLAGWVRAASRRRGSARGCRPGRATAPRSRGGTRNGKPSPGASRASAPRTQVVSLPRDNHSRAGTRPTPRPAGRRA